MKRALLVLPLILYTAFGQPARSVTLITTIDDVSEGELLVDGSSFSVHTDSATEVWKGKTYRDLSPLKRGDEVSILGRWVSGRLIAVRIAADLVRFSGIVQKVGSGTFEIAVKSSQGGARKTVRFYPGTVFSTSSNDLASGERVHVVGLDLRDGTVDAARIAIYNTDIPVRF